MTSVRGLYAIYDRGSLDDDRLEAVADVMKSGAIWLQYRDKRPNAPDLDLVTALVGLSRSHGTKLIINDDWRLAAACGADGVHMGQTDGSHRAARAALGPHAIIGVSCQGSIERARTGLEAGASYVAFGRFFKSATKPDAPQISPEVLSRARALGAPVVAIGGINADNGAGLIAAGADLLAVSGGLFATENPGRAAARLAGLFDQSVG